MQSAELVAVRIAEISEIELAELALPVARRVLAALAARRTARCVPGVNLLRRVEVEAHGPTVRMASRVAVDRLRHHEHSTTTTIGYAALRIAMGFLAEQSVIEALRPVDVVGSDHHMAEHSSNPP